VDTRDLAPTSTDPAQTSAAPQVHVPTAGMAYEGLQEIWKVFPGAHPNAGAPLPAPYAQLTPEVVQLLADEAYRARVEDLVRRDEAIMAARAALAPTPRHRQLPPATAREPKPAALAVPAFVWKYSAIALSTGGGIALAGYGIGAAAPGLAVIDDLLAAAGKAVMSVAVLVLVIGVLLGSLSGTRKTGGMGTVVTIKKAIFKRNRFHG
jgi:hypothetical protein